MADAPEVRRGEPANLEKAIEIKRRAQRCIQNGDLDGALNEYEKLVGSEESDPYNYVLLADLLYKKGDQGAASERYLSAVASYEKASLYKNAIAVCKKMLRLSLSPAKVLQSLGDLHALDGLTSEAALYFVQYAEHMVRSSDPVAAAKALRRAFDVSQENVRVLEQMSEAWLLAGENTQAAQALVEASNHYRQRGAEADARRCTERAAVLDGSAPPVSEAAPVAAVATPAEPVAVEEAPAAPAISHLPEPGAIDLRHDHEAPAAPAPAPVGSAPVEHARVDGFETGRHEVERPALPPLDAEPAAETAAAPEDFPVHEIEADEEPEIEVIAETEPEAEPELEIDNDVEPETAFEIEEPVGPPTGPIERMQTTEAIAAAGAEAVYEISDADAAYTPPPAEPYEEPVYVISDEEAAETEPTPEPAAPMPPAPSLAFEQTAAAAPAPAPEANPLAAVEELLTRAQEQFRAGHRDEASHTLTQAARAYEVLERYDSAATIYRSLGRGAHATPEIIELWLANCEHRHDVREAAQVACDLGDRALNDGDQHSARSWFERAIAYDGGNETAKRRLQRLDQASTMMPMPEIPTATATAPEPAPVAQVPAAPAAEQKVEVAVGRAEAVSFDLAGLLAEFQRGVESQLAGDPQSHYDLGMTYREMGLYDQAMDSFRQAKTDPRLSIRASEMMGRCLADQGRWGDALAEFARALEMPDVGPENDLELRYHFGHALAEKGRFEEALHQYQVVAERFPGFEDVEERVTAMRRVLGQP